MKVAEQATCSWYPWMNLIMPLVLKYFSKQNLEHFEFNFELAF